MHYKSQIHFHVLSTKLCTLIFQLTVPRLYDPRDARPQRGSQHTGSLPPQEYPKWRRSRLDSPSCLESGLCCHGLCVAAWYLGYALRRIVVSFPFAVHVSPAFILRVYRLALGLLQTPGAASRDELDLHPSTCRGRVQCRWIGYSCHRSSQSRGNTREHTRDPRADIKAFWDRSDADDAWCRRQC